MNQIKHRVGINTEAARVYEALSTDAGLARWWTRDTRGAGPVGSIIEFRFGDHGPDFEVIELIPDKLVRWRHHGNMPAGWMGSEILFDLHEDGKQTLVNFAHYQWQKSDEFLAHCSTKWGIFMMSLKDCLESGEGNPWPNDIHIDYDE